MPVDFFSAMEVSASGLAVERTRVNVASSNLANANSTKGPDGTPYKRLDVMIQTRNLPASLATPMAGQPAPSTVEVTGLRQDTTPPRLEYDPNHPDANAEGYVAYPNVNAIEEMVDMITASRAYQAGVTALDTATQLAERALGIGR